MPGGRKAEAAGGERQRSGGGKCKSSHGGVLSGKPALAGRRLGFDVK
jgi:hypothetical protein